MKPVIHETANIWGSKKIGNYTKIGAFCDIGDAKIGSDCKIQCHVSIPPGWTIGENVFIGPGARFANDKYPDAYTAFHAEPCGVVEDYASIGMGAIILPVRIGRGAKIGAGAVVTKDVPAGETWVGNPARPI